MNFNTDRRHLVSSSQTVYLLMYKQNKFIAD